MRGVVKLLEQEAPAVEVLIANARRQAELAHQRWEAQQQEWERQREEQRRRKAAEASRQELYRVIEAWNEAKRLDAFLRELDEAGAALDEKQRAIFLDRLKQARAMIGVPDALGKFQAWKTPDETLVDTP